jgi:hypothetical protein
MRYSTSELHRLINCYKRMVNTLVARWTLAIIPFAYSLCQAFNTPLHGLSNLLPQRSLDDILPGEELVTKKQIGSCDAIFLQ